MSEEDFDFNEYKLENREALLQAFDCDINWQKIIINRRFLVAFMSNIFKETGVKNVRMAGSCVYGFPEDNLSSLVDPYTVDLISSNMTKRKPRKRGMQYIFGTFREYLENRKPMKKMCNVYFVGDGHGEGEQTIDVHWNCFIIDLRENVNKIVWYDPSEETNVRGSAYNFLKEKKKVITELLKEMTGLKPIDLKTKYRAQQFCAKHPAQDVFCQTWVIMFVDVYLNNIWDRYTTINFIKWQNQPF